MNMSADELDRRSRKLVGMDDSGLRAMGWGCLAEAARDDGRLLEAIDLYGRAIAAARAARDRDEVVALLCERADCFSDLGDHISCERDCVQVEAVVRGA